MIKKRHIVFTGPESSGKSTLSAWLHQKTRFPLVVEYARIYGNKINRKFKFQDLLAISDVQVSEQQQFDNNQWVIYDTDLLTTIIWAELKFAKHMDNYREIWKKSLKHKLFFLCVPDIPWEADSLREDPDKRMQLLVKYRSYLIKNNANFIEVAGEQLTRKKTIIREMSQV